MHNVRRINRHEQEAGDENTTDYSRIWKHRLRVHVYGEGTCYQFQNCDVLLKVLFVRDARNAMHGVDYIQKSQRGVGGGGSGSGGVGRCS